MVEVFYLLFKNKFVKNFNEKTSVDSRRIVAQKKAPAGGVGAKGIAANNKGETMMKRVYISFL
ncbi:hypothetical protein OL229_13480 [Neisseriaceae bacterium JH1-16]|nr:hypothetical protein [Neisseriaceae bacterium JH1-16]